jgi:alpha-tubulin suppressor-like RCC1 family protein
VPVQVLGITTGILVNAGGFHTCATTTSDAVLCWGYNANGQLGNGNTNNSNQPVAVQNL